MLSSIDISKYICYTTLLRVSEFQHQSFTSCDLKVPSSVSRLQLPLNSIQAIKETTHAEAEDPREGTSCMMI